MNILVKMKTMAMTLIVMLTMLMMVMMSLKMFTMIRMIVAIVLIMVRVQSTSLAIFLRAANVFLCARTPGPSFVLPGPTNVMSRFVRFISGRPTGGRKWGTNE